MIFMKTFLISSFLSYSIMVENYFKLIYFPIFNNIYVIYYQIYQITFGFEILNDLQNLGLIYLYN